MNTKTFVLKFRRLIIVAVQLAFVIGSYILAFHLWLEFRVGRGSWEIILRTLPFVVCFYYFALAAFDIERRYFPGSFISKNNRCFADQRGAVSFNLMKRVLLTILILIFLIIGFFLIGKPPIAKKITWGVNFSQMHTELMGLDWRETYSAL